MYIMALWLSDAHRYIYHLHPVCFPPPGHGEDGSTLQSCVGPFLPVWVRDIESGDGNGLDLVGLPGDDSLDGLLVLLKEDRGHFLSRVKRAEVRVAWSMSTGERSCEVLLGVGIRLPWVIQPRNPTEDSRCM